MKMGWRILFAVVVLVTALGLAAMNRPPQAAAQSTVTPTPVRTGLRLATTTAVSEQDIVENAPAPPPGCAANPCLLSTCLLAALAGGGRFWLARWMGR